MPNDFVVSTATWPAAPVLAAPVLAAKLAAELDAAAAVFVLVRTLVCAAIVVACVMAGQVVSTYINVEEQEESDSVCKFS
jgi:hypothetical protein